VKRRAVTADQQVGLAVAADVGDRRGAEEVEALQLGREAGDRGAGRSSKGADVAVQRQAAAGEQQGTGDACRPRAGLGVGEPGAEVAEGAGGREVDRDVGRQVALQGLLDRRQAADRTGEGDQGIGPLDRAQ
jgi:hypothetical protein